LRRRFNVRYGRALAFACEGVAVVCPGRRGREQQRRLAQTVAHLLKPGGAYSFVEISVPPFLPLRAAFMFYLTRLIPLIGRLLLGNPDSYRMLGVYTQAFDNATHFAGCLREAGLAVVPVSYLFGCATGVRGIKPPAV
jgi:ubiquinone/menaquinone biosynthesis C-methylase UbiE